MHTVLMGTESLQILRNFELPRELEVIARVLNPVSLSTPDNFDDVRTKFLNDRIEPVFTYTSAVADCLAALKSQGIVKNDIPNILHKLQEELDALPNSGCTGLAAQVITERLTDEIHNLELLIARMNNDPVAAMVANRKIYGSTIDPNLVQVANVIVSESLLMQTQPGVLTTEQRTALENQTHDAEDIKAAFEDALKILYQRCSVPIPAELKYTVLIGNYSSIDVRDKSPNGPIIGIPEARKVDGITLLKLIEHEINAHCRQSINGWLQSTFAGGSRKPNDETLYEDLVIRAEKINYGIIWRKSVACTILCIRNPKSLRWNKFY